MSNPVYFVVLLLNAFAVSAISAAYESDMCIVKHTNEIGYCKYLKDCQLVVNDMRNKGIPPTKCIYPYICCPKSEVERIHKEKLLELMFKPNNMHNIKYPFHQQKPNQVFHETKDKPPLVFEDELPKITTTTTFRPKTNKKCISKMFTDGVSSKVACNKDYIVKNLLQSLVDIGYDEDGDMVYKCSGVIINKNYVLTSADCVYYENKYLAQSILPINSGKMSYIHQITAKRDTEDTINNNVAILKIFKSIMEADVKPIVPSCKATEKETFAIVASWSRRNPKNITLERVEVLSPEKCSLSESTQELMCVKVHTYAKVNSVVIKLGNDCLPSIEALYNYQNSIKTVVYTKVNYYLDWIEKHTKET